MVNSMSIRPEIDVDKLIKKVAAEPPIWDKRVSSYSCREVVDDCWRRISKDMGNPEHKLRKKWKYLRDQFCVELGRIHTGGETKWVQYNHLSFLTDIVKPRLTKHTHRDSADDDDDSSMTNDDVKSYQMMVGVDDQSTADPLGDESNGHWSGGYRKRKADGGLKSDSRWATSNLKTEPTSIADGKDDVAELILKNRQAGEEDENDDILFFRSLLPYVSKIADHKKMRFRSKILQLVDEFAYGTDTSNTDSTVK